VLLVVLIPILPWLLIGPRFEALTAGLLPAGEVHALVWWSGPVGVLLLASDSFLPVPATLTMSALGLMYGWVVGGLLAWLGLFLSGLVAYGVCRKFGHRLAVRIAGESGLERMRLALDSYGPVLIAATRSVPVLQEASSCLAGLAGMRPRAYFLALLLGSLPAGFAYAAIGATAVQDKGLAVWLSVLVPVLTWPLIWLLVRRARAGS
jgi:uncharacterized membrane protein YdjX (TVP38/TMEM64 family)